MDTSTVTNVKLTSCELVQEDGEEYLYLIYTFEDDAGTYELHIPRVELRINHDTLPELGYRHGVGRVTLLGREFTLKECKSIYLPTLNGEYERFKDVSYAIRTIEEKRVEMTMEEIEKKLGYKVKIVSEK